MIKTEEDLSVWQREWANYHVLLAMAALGLFDLLADGQPRTADTIAYNLGADTRAVDMCCRILVRSELLLYEDDQFRLAQVSQELADPIRELKWTWRRRHNYANLYDVIRTGRPAMVTSGGVVEDNEQDTRQFLSMLYRQSEKGAREAVKIVAQVVEQNKIRAPRILDLGGGHGRYAATFAAEIPGAQVTLFDREIVTRIAPEIAGPGFATRSGDFLCDDLGQPYDVVFMAFVVSGISLDEVRGLFRRLRAVVVPGGTVIVEDMFVDPETLQPAFAIDFNLTLLLENEHGRFRTVGDLGEIMQQAGFPVYQHIKVSGQDFSFIVGT